MSVVRLIGRHARFGGHAQTVQRAHCLPAALMSALSPGLPSSSRSISTSPPLRKPPSPELLAVSALNTEEDHALARAWLDEFVPEDIPKSAYDVSYARSSGPGGQHVNKTNSKAVIHCNIHKGKWLPPYVVAELQKTSYYHPPNLVFSSQASRSAPQNLAAALTNMHEVILKAGRGPVRGETSDEKKERVRGLAEAEKERRRAMKDKQKSKKENRRKDW